MAEQERTPQSFDPSGFTETYNTVPEDKIVSFPGVDERRRQQRALYRAQQQNTPGAPGIRVEVPNKKLTGIWFVIMFLLAATKDLLDLGANMSVIFSVLTFLPSLMIGGILLLYYFLSGVSLTMRKAAAWSFGIILGSIPGISFLPETVISLLLIRYFENNDLARNLVELGQQGKIELSKQVPVTQKKAA